ncbi:ABC transporter ATP-binding protein [Aestuariivirga sp. YIM B02566]|uniref:ABC transporter ATP-binding protein n=1 Tax=Taklimakanibacter albus TaxID=2800327 RepID=A0ACC5R9L1_9HYPH|nr:ABC transporter ATP-binding protein [Aestuariivirga sp. YIM B02566]MBK1869302.1 ABC transporter ATP-binding protein [Aestuariivirga sp. YIM B02566]
MASARPVLRPAPAPAEQPAPVHLSAEGVAVDFDLGGRTQRVLTDIHLKIGKGQLVALVGPSGCGKSTLLRLFAGLMKPSAGKIEVAGMSPVEAARQKRIGVAFQDATLLPWKTALDNAAFLLETADPSLSRAEVRARAETNLHLVGLAGAEGKRPSQLSGGMRQRVAIARALTLDPEVLLLDEPFGALDAITREEMGTLLLDIWQRTQKTVLLVTHAFDEAVFLASDIHVMGTGPARIIETIASDLPYPRDAQTYRDPRFAALEARLRELLVKSHKGAT